MKAKQLDVSSNIIAIKNKIIVLTNKIEWTEITLRWLEALKISTILDKKKYEKYFNLIKAKYIIESQNWKEERESIDFSLRLLHGEVDLENPVLLNSTDLTKNLVEHHKIGEFIKPIKGKKLTKLENEHNQRLAKTLKILTYIDSEFDTFMEIKGWYDSWWVSLPIKIQNEINMSFQKIMGLFAKNLGTIETRKATVSRQYYLLEASMKNK